MKQLVFSKWVLVGAAVLAIGTGAFSNRLVARAQAMNAQSFVVQAGVQGYAGVDVLAFAPANLQVHRGDTVTWMINSVHDVHFEEAPVPLIVAPEVDGQPLPQINPAVAFRSLDTGSPYQGGDANSGIPLKPEDTMFSLVMDVDPGTYSYFCDVHPGMVGTVTVVPDDTAIPSAAEVELQGSSEFASSIQAAEAASFEAEAQPAQSPGQVQAGLGGTGRATVNQYFPFASEIKAGDSVTFTIPSDSIEGHTISWPPTRNQDVIPQEVQGAPPILSLGPSVAPMTQSGASVGVGDAFSSGLLEPGQSFTLTFTKPGIYPFVCNIHPGMGGVVVVQPNS